MIGRRPMVVWRTADEIQEQRYGARGARGGAAAFRALARYAPGAWTDFRAVVEVGGVAGRRVRIVPDGADART